MNRIADRVQHKAFTRASIRVSNLIPVFVNVFVPLVVVIKT